jgi:acyl-[acyl-carrier-protein] desaturase
MTTTPMRDIDILTELEPVVAKQVDRHMKMAKEWFPHEYVPWSQGRDFDVEPWSPEQSHLTPIVQTSLEVNLLTEDNLPSYHREIDRSFGRDGAWGFWVNRWTAEEGRHGIVMRDYLLVTRAVDPVQLERDRMVAMQEGYDASEKDMLRSVAYVSFQELATRIAHRNTGIHSQDPVCDKILARVAADENLHMIFYRDLVSAALQITPSQTVKAIAAEVLAFQMPGTGIRNFTERAMQIAHAGIYDLRIHVDEILWPVLRQWKFFEVEGLDAEAEQAREAVAKHMKRLDRLAGRFESQRAAKRAEEVDRGENPLGLAQV